MPEWHLFAGAAAEGVAQPVLEVAQIGQQFGREASPVAMQEMRPEHAALGFQPCHQVSILKFQSVGAYSWQSYRGNRIDRIEAGTIIIVDPANQIAEFIVRYCHLSNPTFLPELRS